MANVELRPGDTLNLIWSSVQETPLGMKQVESSLAFSYEELLAKLKEKGQFGKSRRSGTEGARFSRNVALSTNAIRKGKWSTGAVIDKGVVFDKLAAKFNTLDKNEYQHITSNAKDSFIYLAKIGSFLNLEQKSKLKDILAKLKLKIDD